MCETSHHLQITPPVVLLPMQSIFHFTHSLQEKNNQIQARTELRQSWAITAVIRVIVQLGQVFQYL